jgi:hypothetical protein
MRYFVGRGKPQLLELIKMYPDDWAGLDVRGKVVVLVRFIGVNTGTRGNVDGPTPGDSIHDALERGAAGVIFVDPAVGDQKLTIFPTLQRYGLNPYDSIETEFPAYEVTGAPVIIVDPIAASRLLAPLGVDVTPFMDWDTPASKWTYSSRQLNVRARLEVPLRADTTTATSVVGEVPGFADDVGRIVVWAEMNIGGTSTETARRDALASVATYAAQRRLPFIFVYFNKALGADEIRSFLHERRVLLVVVLGEVERTRFRFTTPNGDLIPAFDLYAENAGLQHDITRRSAPSEFFAAPLRELKTIIVDSVGEKRDARGDVLALMAYASGRRTLGAPELGP